MPDVIVDLDRDERGQEIGVTDSPMSGQADAEIADWAYEPVPKPDPSIVAEVAGSVCTGMVLAGVEVYKRWLENTEKAEEWADLVSSIYAAMRAQQIAINAQSSLASGSPAKSAA